MYELSAVLTGHSADVRCCCMDEQGHIITGSRDNTAIVWEQVPGSKSTPAANRWKIKCKLSGHNSFVNCVAVLPASTEFPQGLILTGGQDKKILVHCLGVDDPVSQLTGHTEAVTCLSTGMYGTIVSGSADTTVRVWLDMQFKEELKGHSGPVWDAVVYPGNGLYLSASGDKTIRLWDNGKEKRVFKGHLEAVRKLLILLNGAFLSCSNDGNVRHWDISGACISTLTIGSSFLYSMSLLDGLNGGYAVTGENGNLMIVGAGEIKQGIQIPALSVWCSSPLPNSDVLIGSSDGLARIFTQDPTQFAPLEDRERMIQEVAAQKHSKRAIGDLELDQLQGVEALNRPGKEGQVMMVNNDSTVEIHKFVGGKWQKIGVVQDAYDADKHELDGQKYDFVIDVDVEQGQAPIKLGCNKGDDPWRVAQDFIMKHSVPQVYLNEIADYVSKHIGTTTKPMEFSSEYCDPYTGSSRYIPTDAVDTGAAGAIGTTRYYPEHTLAQDIIPEAGKLIDKILEFNKQISEDSRLDISQQSRLEQMKSALKAKANRPSTDHEAVVPSDLVIVTRLLTWDKDHIFPCLDLVRSINRAYPSLMTYENKIRIAQQNYQTTSTIACVRVALRLMGDITFQHTNTCLEQYFSVIEPLMDRLNTTDRKYVSTSLTKILHNMTCLECDINKSTNILSNINTLLAYILRELPDEKDPKVAQLQFQLLISTGNLITRHPDLILTVNITSIQKLTSAKITCGKTKIAAKDILRNFGK